MKCAAPTYTNGRIETLIRDAGFSAVQFLPGLGGLLPPWQEEMFAILVLN